MTNTPPQTIDDYIAGFPPDVQRILRKMRRTIRQAAPQAAEAIKYQMPTFVLNGNLVSFGVYQKHLGVYPVPLGTAKFRRDIAPYRSAKSTARFPLTEPIPFDLIGQLVKLRAQENLTRAAAKKRQPSAKTSEGFLATLSAPARQALEHEGVTSVKQLARYSEAEILALHGVGPGSLPRLREALKSEKRDFRQP